MTSLGPWFGGRGGAGSSLFDPFSRSDLFDLWDNLVGRRGRDQGNEIQAFAQANVDWRETDKSHIFTVDLPGVRKDDLKVQVEDDNVLQISGDRVAEEEEENDKWHRVERRRGSFLRRFRLPEDAEVENIRCELEQGVLKVDVPKKEVQEQQRNVRCIDIA